MLEFSIAFLDGWIEGERDEVLRHWRRVRDAAVARSTVADESSTDGVAAPRVTELESIARQADCVHVDLNGDRAKALERLAAFAALVRAHGVVGAERRCLIHGECFGGKCIFYDTEGSKS